MRMGVLPENAEGRWMAYWAGLAGFNAREAKPKHKSEYESHNTGASPQRA